MPPAAIGGTIAGVGSIAGGVMGANAQQDAADAAARLGQQATAEYENIKLPTIDEQLLQLQEIKNAGNLTPEQEQTLTQKESELNSYKQNPEAYTAQMQALQQLQKIGSEGGLTAMDRAQLNQIQNQVNAQEQSNRAAIGQNYQARGMGGSGVELAQQLAGNQAATQTAADQGFNVAAQAQQRALQAIQGAGQMGQGIESQQFGEAGQKAAAQNAINQFNTANAQNIAGQNVQRANYAQQANLANQQQLNSANTNIANQQQIANKGLYQQDYQNQLAKAGGVSNALNKQAQNSQAQGQANANLYSGIGQAAAKVGTGLMNYGLSSKKDSDTTEF
jgi:hypothetical protein